MTTEHTRPRTFRLEIDTTGREFAGDNLWPQIAEYLNMAMAGCVNIAANEEGDCQDDDRYILSSSPCKNIGHYGLIPDQYQE